MKKQDLVTDRSNRTMNGSTRFILIVACALCVFECGALMARFVGVAGNGAPAPALDSHYVSDQAVCFDQAIPPGVWACQFR